MPVDLSVILIFGLLIAFSFTIEGITGFGSIVLVLPFACMLTGVETAVLVLVSNALVMQSFLVKMDFKYIAWKQWKIIIGFAGLGLPIGMWMIVSLPEYLLKIMLGVFTVVVGARGLVISYRKAPAEENKTAAPVIKKIYYFLLFIGGIIHGAFGAGAPLLVIYTTKVLPDKRNFRVTLSATWVTLNLVLVSKNLIYGSFAPTVTTLVLGTLPFMLLGLLMGNRIHHKVDIDAFCKLVYSILLLAGASMLISILLL